MKRVSLGALLLVVLSSGVLRAQGLQPFGQLGRSGAEDQVTVKLIADVKDVIPDRPFYLGVLFEIPKGYYTYYKSAGQIAQPTKVSFNVPEGFEVGPVEFPAPEVKYDDVGGKTMVSYVYKRNTVVMAKVTPPVKLRPGQKVTFSANVRYMYCLEKGSCFPAPPASPKLSLPVLPVASKPVPSDEERLFARARAKLPMSGLDSPHVRVSAHLRPAHLEPNGNATLVVTANIDDGFKIQQNRPPVKGLISTDLILNDVKGISKFPMPEYPKPVPANLKFFENKDLGAYKGKIQIKVPVTARKSLAGPTVTFSGILQYQACDESRCFPPEYATFSVTVPVSDKGTTAVPNPVGPVDGSTPAAGSAPDKNPVVASSTVPQIVQADEYANQIFDNIETDEDKQGSLALFILYAFLGGIILNVMPCVLPVIAIKVLGFVQQAGESRSRILLLNVMYSAGVISVFLILASLAVFLGIGWGGLFQKPEFNLVMAGIVFAMGLSLLGVFEIPVPGFLGSKAGGYHQEGPLGAFMTGIMATLLATPCSGPFLGTALGWSVRQPWIVTYAVWLSIGLGMSFPYLLCGIFPAAIKLLPKPGNWMITFKEFAGFFLMGTVIYIMSYIDPTYMLPLVVMMLGMAVGVWISESWSNVNSPLKRKIVVRGIAVATACTIGFIGFTSVRELAYQRNERDITRIVRTEKEKWMARLANVIKSDETISQEDKRELIAQLDEAEGPMAVATTKIEEAGHTNELPWQPFTENKLGVLLNEGKTVLVDFSADWCLTCKRNESVALNTQETRNLVKQLGVIPLYADYTDQSDEIKKWLEKFGSISVPLLVIFPGDRPTKPIVLHDLYSQDQILAKLKEAGASVGHVADPAQQTALLR
ncbi:Thiol:disulfide interchange protein DsbD precursor [Planctomycetes bacterium Pan216]|uniref:Thiol:disulfide interchange protein DsbD n=1 Tax=Kolteria novifilia TaxID=2527975 RepID=A0A518B1E7_9BACT|nr:Thiol:disulfide interchange protein DsbD precursor [Planctomycetes bacterium Pan216]